MLGRDFSTITRSSDAGYRKAIALSTDGVCDRHDFPVKAVSTLSSSFRFPLNFSPAPSFSSAGIPPISRLALLVVPSHFTPQLGGLCFGPSSLTPLPTSRMRLLLAYINLFQAGIASH